MTAASSSPVLLRLDNIGLVVDDLPAAVAFFAALGMEPVGEASLEGPAVDQLIGLPETRTAIALMRTPDGRSQLELTTFRQPAAHPSAPQPENTLGKCRIMFAVTDLHAMVARLQQHGAELVGDVVEYEDQYRLVYLRGPAGLTVALAEELGGH